ncbi:MAG TPA: DEAD/DEAH box helicase [Bryobacteraceae bacterium]|jgi:SNF2 family DNA or RNA helicase
MSLVLQANWHDQSLYLWARRPQPGEPPVDVAAIRAAVGEITSDALLASTAREGRIVIALPGSNGEADVESPALILGPAEAIDFLTSLPCGTVATCGPSVTYWCTLARFVLRLIAAKQFVPRIEECEEEALCASWRVLVSDREQLQWLERFAAAMPPVCRAMRAARPEQTEAAHLVETFLGATTDALIRRAVADDPFFQRVHEKAASEDAPAEVRWLSGLLGPSRVLREGDYEQTEAFVQQARAWLGQLDDSQAAALRLCFVLHEPPDDERADENGDGESPGAAAVDSPQSEVPWILTLHLQGVDGEGELIDAASLWQAHARAAILGRSVAKRQAALLSELARAAEVFPPAQSLLAHPAPSQLTLSTTDAYAFIRHWAPLLRDRDFAVTLPDWASDPDEEIGLRMVLSPTDDLDDLFDPFNHSVGAAGSAAKRRGGTVGDDIELSTGHFGLDSLMNFDWQIAVGNVRLSTAEFEHLVAKNQPLVKHKGRWIHLDLDATRKALEFVKKKPGGGGGQITLADAFRTAFTANKAETGLNVIGMTGTSWLERLLEQAPGKSIEQIPQPQSFGGDLRPYQLRGLHWLTFLDRLGLGACLADDMGLGKTIQLIALLLHERERMKGSEFSVERSELQRATAAAALTAVPDRSHSELDTRNSGPGTRAGVGPTLLFAPTSVVGNWLREVQRFAKALRVMVHHGPERLTGETFAREAGRSDLVITSYSLAHRDKEELARVAWHRIALDEAQKIKNPAAASTIAIRSLYAPHRVALTGTPIENHLSELWSIMQVLNPGLLGTAADFREKFAVPIEKLGEKDRAQQLRQMIRPFILRRTKQDPTIAGDLPEKLEMKVFCNLTSEQAALYERFVNDSLRQIDAASGIRRRGLILATLTRLKQICNHPALLEKESATALDHRSGKCERLVDMLEELLEEGDAALVFTQYREMGHLLETLIDKRLSASTFFLHGGTPAKTRDQMIQAFQAQENGAPRIFLLSLRAGGLGLNLTAANHVFHFDRWWNPAVEAQATDRAHRVGQTRTVQVHKFVCIGTMEERIDRLLTEKQALADQIVGSGDEWLTNLSTEQLREYLTLSKEAVGEFD